MPSGALLMLVVSMTIQTQTILVLKMLPGAEQAALLK